MSELTQTQLKAINNMTAEQRYDYFIKQVVELKQVWGLSSDTGWLILPDGDEDLWSDTYADLVELA